MNFRKFDLGMNSIGHLVLETVYYITHSSMHCVIQLSTVKSQTELEEGVMKPLSTWQFDSAHTQFRAKSQNHLEPFKFGA